MTTDLPRFPQLLTNVDHDWDKGLYQQNNKNKPIML